jgi:RHS repeat-associated protein
VQQLSSAALGNYERLRLRVLVPQDGYVTAFVGNESDVDVYFDDVTVELRQGLQVQETHYDPTGLELAGLTGTTPGLKSLSQYKFNGKEFQPDLGLNWNHQDWRFFDTQLARWHVTDPEIENGQEAWTPYSFGFDNAVRYADADGRCPGGCPPSDVLPAPSFLARAAEAINLSGLVNDLKSTPIGPELAVASEVLIGLQSILNIASIAPQVQSIQPQATLPSDRAYAQPTAHAGNAVLNATAAENLPRMKGSSSAKVEKTMAREGFSLTRRTSTGNSTYTHPDGSEVRHHPYGNERLSPHKSANNAHLHKQNPSPAKEQLDDKGRVSTDPNETHIGTRNPANLPQVRGRPHGA